MSANGFTIPSFVGNNAAATKVAPTPTTNTVTPTVVTEDATIIKPKKKREIKATRSITDDDEKFIVANIKTMSYADMAEKLGLTESQITTHLGKIRGGSREYLLQEDPNSYPTFEQVRAGKVITMHDYTKPQTDKARALEAKIAEQYSRPEESRVGGKRGSATAGMVSKRISSLIEGL